MAQYNTFFIPHRDDGGEQERLNAFLRGHRVIRVRDEVFPDGWAFCVEWLEGTGSAGEAGAQLARRREKTDYMKVLPPEVFRKFAAMREVRKALAEKAGLYARLFDAGVWGESELQERITALTAFLRQAGSLEWRRRYFRGWNDNFGRRRGASGSNRVLRGGSWNNNANNCASSYRNNNNPSNENNNNGFRLFCSAVSSGLRRRQMIPADVQSVPAHGETPSPAAAGRPVDAVLERRGGTLSILGGNQP